MTKFVGSVVVVNEDVDMDVQLVGEMMKSEKGKLEIYETAASHNGEIFIVDDNLELAENVAYMLNQAYEEFLEAEAVRKEVQTAFESDRPVPATGGVEDTAINNVEKESIKNKEGDVVKMNKQVNKEVVENNVEKIIKSKAAQEFLKKHSGLIQGAQRKVEANKKEEEVEMKEETKVVGRRRLSVDTKQVETKEKEMVEVKETKRMGGRRRLSTGAVESRTTKAPSRKVETSRRRIARGKSMKQEFQKFEGPWYLNQGIYTNLKEHLEEALETMAVESLGITNIEFVEPMDIPRFARRHDVDDFRVIIQVKAAGAILEFPIKDNMYSNSKSDLNSPAIGWETYNGKISPVFGSWKANVPHVNVTCTCGNRLENVSVTNIYCANCKTRHEDMSVFVEPGAKSEIAQASVEVPNYVFETNPNLYVSRDILALVMAMAQYDAGYDMWGLIEDEEDAE